MFQALIHIVETQEDIIELCCLSVCPSSHPLRSKKVRKSESQHSEEEMTIYLDCPSNKSLKKIRIYFPQSRKGTEIHHVI